MARPRHLRRSRTTGSRASAPWPLTWPRSWTAWAIRATPWSGTTAGPTSRCGWRSTSPTGSPTSRCSTACPICEALDRCGADFAQRWFHWFFYAQPDRPERVILADPLAWYGAGDPDRMGPENHAEYSAAVTRPATVRAMLEDYRAGLAVDQHDERADRAASRTVDCPMLLLWSTRDDLADLYGDPLAVWRPWAPQVTGHGIEYGHHMAEGNPADLVSALQGLLASEPPGSGLRRRRSGS